MSQNDRSIELLTEVLLSHSALGSDELLRQLKTARKEKEELSRQELEIKRLHDNVINLVITKVCAGFGVSKKELMHGSSHGDRTKALMVISVVLTKVLRYSGPEISKILGKDRSNISRDIGQYNQLRAENKWDKPIIDICDQATAEATDHLLKVKNKKTN